MVCTWFCFIFVTELIIEPALGYMTRKVEKISSLMSLIFPRPRVLTTPNKKTKHTLCPFLHGRERTLEAAHGGLDLLSLCLCFFSPAVLHHFPLLKPYTLWSLQSPFGCLILCHWCNCFLKFQYMVCKRDLKKL